MIELPTCPGNRVKLQAAYLALRFLDLAGLGWAGSSCGQSRVFSLDPEGSWTHQDSARGWLGRVEMQPPGLSRATLEANPTTADGSCLSQVDPHVVRTNRGVLIAGGEDDQGLLGEAHQQGVGTPNAVTVSVMGAYDPGDGFTHDAGETLFQLLIGVQV